MQTKIDEVWQYDQCGAIYKRYTKRSKVFTASQYVAFEFIMHESTKDL